MKLIILLVIAISQCYLTEGRGVNGGFPCAVCTVVFGMAEQLAEIHNETLLTASLRLCRVLPETSSKYCVKVIEDLEPLLINPELQKIFTPDVICYGIGICHADSGFCHLFPPPEPQAARSYVTAFNAMRHTCSVDLCTLPGIREICWMLEKSWTSMGPVVDFDGDSFSLLTSARGSNWRGRDCRDFDRDSYPGRLARDHDWSVDANCNGVWGVDEATGQAYEPELCHGSGERGVIYLGDSVGAHFHFPEAWMNPALVSMLKRWLKCRGLPQKGNRQELIARVTASISHGPHPIDPAIDQGKWYDQALAAAQLSVYGCPAADLNSSPPPPPNQDVWEDLVSQKICPPAMFNEGNIYHHIVESVQSVNMFIVPPVPVSDVGTTSDSDSGADSVPLVDAHTSKPLKKGKLFFSSGHVQNIKCKSDGSIFYVKCDVKASFKKCVYHVNMKMSVNSGYVHTASCNCKASAMGRCNHVAALLFAILDFVNNIQGKSSTSQTCTWNVGRKMENDPKCRIDLMSGIKLN